MTTYGENQDRQRGRVATSLLFLLFGTALGTWTSRIPAVKAGLGLSDGSLSIARPAFAGGGEGVLLVPPAYAPNLATLAVALFVFGAVHGTLNIAMNANAIEVQRAWGRPIMSSFHAVYSIGAFLGSAVGGLFARGGPPARGTVLAGGRPGR